MTTGLWRDVFLNPLLLDEIASFLKHPYALDVVCQEILNVRAEYGKYYSSIVPLELLG
jgi:hypothetical protein